MPDQYDIAPTDNDTLANAVALGASTTNGLTLYNAVLYPSDPGNDQDWYIVYGSAGYQYTVSAAPDTGFVYPYMFMEIFGPDKVTLVGQVPAPIIPPQLDRQQHRQLLRSYCARVRQPDQRNLSRNLDLQCANRHALAHALDARSHRHTRAGPGRL